MPNPLHLFLRLCVVSLLVLWPAYLYQRTLVTPLLPLIESTVKAAQHTFAINSVDIATEGPNEVVRLRANLAAPTYVHGRTFSPIEGWFEVTLTAGGVLQYSLMVLIVILSWPASHWKIWRRRILIALPLMLGLLLLNVAITFPAELWAPIHDEWIPDQVSPLLVSSRFLMGGGGLVLGLVCGTIAVAFGNRGHVLRVT